jgi:hypothetical protein
MRPVKRDPVLAKVSVAHSSPTALGRDPGSVELSNRRAVRRIPLMLSLLFQASRHDFV